MNKAGLCLVLALMAAELRGQAKIPPQYRVQIRMRETNPKSTPKDSTHSLLLQAEAKGTLNASYRIPYDERRRQGVAHGCTRQHLRLCSPRSGSRR
jgi:hypothetical protein